MSIAYTKPKYRMKSWLKNEYMTNNRTIKEIAKECKVSRGTIRRWTSNFTLKKRTPKSTDYRNKEWLYEEYIVKNKKRGEIAKEQDVHIDTIAYWLSQHQIKKNYY
ncbi:MAG: hypothetical protein KJI71_00605 [Patescibacteria group bacterium]|nr:hypothetical protein [Patescibacteria group bacterium]